MTSTLHLQKFDPAEHPGNVYDAFDEFIDSFAYEYEAIAKQPPTGTTDNNAWAEQDKRKQLLGRFAARNLQMDFEDEVSAAERSTITFTDTVTKLKTRYKPTRNTTLANYEFHKLQQLSLETFDTFANRVKHEAKGCEFSCNDACTVLNVMVRDQIIIGTSDDAIRKAALNEQWSLTDLLAKGRKLEAAAFGAEKIKKESGEVEINRLKPGKYSRKSKGVQGMKCKNCSNKMCHGGEKCSAKGRECFQCGKTGHFKGSENCQKSSKQGARRIKEKGKVESSEDSDTQPSADEEESQHIKRISEKKIHSARFVSHVRCSKATRKLEKSSRYQVPVMIRENMITMFADTGADVSVIPASLATELDLPLLKTKMRIKPYGMKRKIKCIGYYVGPVMYKNLVAHIGIYVVKEKVEALLSGAASEMLGIISFHGDDDVPQLRRSEAVQDPEKQVLMSQYPDIFIGVGKLQNYQVTLHIDSSVPPVACPPRPVPYHLQAQLDREIRKMEEAGVVEDHEGPAPWTSNIVLAPKDDGGVRVTIDMRQANKAIQDTRLPIPRAEDIRKELAGCHWFSKLDFRTAFHQLELSQESRYLTVFHHGGKLKRYTRLTMGTKPASGELNKAIRPLFNNLSAAHVIHDDLVIATATEKEHHQAIQDVLQVIQKSGLTLNPNKCMFKKKEIPFWGMVISGEGIRPDPSKVQALRDASHPNSKAEVMSFLCMLQANAEFIPQLSRETVHLRQLTQKLVEFRWTKTCQEEFDHVKGLLCKDTLLTYFNPQLSTFLLVDAHKTGISAILAQGTALDKAKMVTCASRATTAVERNYPHLDLEALAVDFALRRFRQYIVGGPQIQVVTDHKPLVSIFKSTRRGSVRTDRIKLRHQDVSYEVIWQPGARNTADFLSRHATKLHNIPKEWKDEAEELEKTVWFLNLSPYTEAISIPRIIDETKKDRRLKKLVQYVKKGYIPRTETKEWRPYRNVMDSITVSDAGLVLKDEKIILPESLWQLAIEKAHQGGHPGITRMKRRVRAHFWIPRLNALVEEKVKECDTCQRFTDKVTKEPIAPQQTTGVAWEEVSIDLFGPLPDKRHVLVVQDTMSRFPAATVVPSTAATPVIKALDDVYKAYGNPERHRTDNGPPFNSKEFQEFSKVKGIEQVLSYPYHPQGNPCETFMKPLGKALKAALYNRENAQVALDELLKAYRSTPHPATQTAPGDILFRHGYHTDFPRTQKNDDEIAAAQ